MRIKDFYTTLNYAINEFNRTEMSKDKSMSKLRYLDENIQMASEYIQRLYKKSKFADKEISKGELSELIIDDYGNIIDEIYLNYSVYGSLMKYLAAKYLSQHLSDIPILLQEAKEKGIEFDENQLYMDDFHNNLLYVCLDLENNYNTYINNLEKFNSEFIDLMRKFVENYGPKEGYIRLCQRYNNTKIYSVSDKTKIMRTAYIVMFGLTGLQTDNLSKEDKALKFKNNSQAKDYIFSYTESLSDDCKEMITNVLLVILNRLNEFGYLSDAAENYKKRLQRIGLPGLKYVFKEEETVNNPSIESIVRYENFINLELQDLVRMISFYNNKLAKVLDNYSLALFFMESIESTYDILKGKTISTSSFDKDDLENLYLKKVVLNNTLKIFFEETQRDIDKNPNKYEVSSIELTNQTQSNMLSVATEVSLENFLKSVREKWRNEYEKYFNKCLRKFNNKLEDNILLENLFYNGIFALYAYKTLGIKSEFACMMKLFGPEESNNYGIILEYNRDGKHIPINSEKYILIASDGRTATNRLHVPRIPFEEFCKSINGNSLIRVYEGAEDFKYIDYDITNQLLLPYTKAQIKYLRDVKSGKLKKSNLTEDSVTPLNEAFIDHTLYSMGESEILLRHSRKEVSFNKKGKPVTKYYPRVRYLDFETDKLYELINGELVEIETSIERSKDDE